MIESRLFQLAADEQDVQQAELFQLLSEAVQVLDCQHQHQGTQYAAQWLLQGDGATLDQLQQQLMELDALTLRVSQGDTTPIGKKLIVTLMAKQLSGAALQHIMQAGFSSGLQLLRSHRLTKDQADYQVLETLWQGDADEVELHGVMLKAAMEMGIDVAVQQDHWSRAQRRLVCFDMDSTLIKAEVIDELAIAAGVGDQVQQITQRAMQGELDFAESFTERMALLKGLDAAVLESIADQLPIMDGAEILIRTLKAMGMKTAIFSGGFTFFAERLQKRLGIDQVFANQLDIVDGKVTGKVTGTIVTAERKAELLQTLADDMGIGLQHTVAVGDGANDLKMLAKAGLGVAFHAKPLVQQQSRHSVTHMGLDGLLYLLGLQDHQMSDL